MASCSVLPRRGRVSLQIRSRALFSSECGPPVWPDILLPYLQRWDRQSMCWHQKGRAIRCKPIKREKWLADGADTSGHCLFEVRFTRGACGWCLPETQLWMIRLLC